MKMPRLLAALFLSAACAMFAAAPAAPAATPELRGELSTGGARRFALAVPGGTQAWVSVGETFVGWTVTDYDAASDTLALSKGGRQVTLGLSSSVLGTSAPAGGGGTMAAGGGTKASLADAEEMLNKMRFEQMMGRVLEQQKKSAAALVRQIATQAGAEQTDEAAAFQGKLLDTMFAELNADALRGDLARAYSEVFTKEELQSLASFYASPAGQAMVDKQPEVAQKISDTMTPRLMAALPKVQQMARDYAAEQAAKKTAAAQAGAK